jgi:hypothetical protein
MYQSIAFVSVSCDRASGKRAGVASATGARAVPGVTDAEVRAVATASIG